MYYIYNSNEPWSELADRGMALSKRWKEEELIFIKNLSEYKIYGFPKIIEI